MHPSVTLPARLTADRVLAEQAALLRLIQQALSGSAKVVCLDARAVQAFDSAGLALLLSCRRQAQAAGALVQVQGWPPGLLALARVYGVLPLLDPEADAAALV